MSELFTLCLLTPSPEEDTSYIWPLEQGLHAWVLSSPGQSPVVVDDAAAVNFSILPGTGSSHPSLLAHGAGQHLQYGVVSLRRPLRPFNREVLRPPSFPSFVLPVRFVCPSS